MATTRDSHEENGAHFIHPLGAAAGAAADTGRSGALLKRRAVAVAFAVLALSAGAATVRAHDKSDKSEQTVIKSRDFTIPKGQCSQLPADLEVKGLGLERTTTVIESADDGGKHAGGDQDRITYSLLSTITGSASDNLGGTYTFSYQLRFKKPSLIPGSAIATDNFRLTGAGAADGMSTFFRVRVTLDSGANPVGFELLEQTGDPFHCDPL
jgi:hypothetical protein